MKKKRLSLRIGKDRVKPGEVRDLALPVSQSYSGAEVVLPLRVEHAVRPGPVVLITAAIHGDELNGTGIVRELVLNRPYELEAGSLILVPVVNILGFERLSRYLPDRRDLNRCFPGSVGGSLSSRFAHTIFNHLVRQSDYCLDFHTAAVRRTNFPNLRADLTNPEVRRLAAAFGCALVVDTPGAQGSLRRTATEDGYPTITLEAGEVWKIERGMVEVGLRGVRNVLIELGMVSGEPERPAYFAEVDKSEWVRASSGGMLAFHIAPGDVVQAQQPIASITSLLGAERGVLSASRDGVVLGITTLPVVKPGDPICHLAFPNRSIGSIRQVLRRLPEGSLHERLRGDLASNVTVTKHEETEAETQCAPGNEAEPAT